MKISYDIIEKLYQLKDEVSILSFLEDNNYLIDFLIDFHKQVTNIFKDNIIAINLNLIHDPDIFDENILFANIYTNLSVDDAMIKIGYLDDDWYLKNINKVKGMFNFDVEWDDYKYSTLEDEEIINKVFNG